jgi:phosphatidylserine/phosphatidylglycerophosphate/cardiolipin synthase-like enzyme
MATATPNAVWPCLLGLLAVAACSAATTEDQATSPDAPQERAAPTIALGESWPAETTLDDPSIADADAVWLAMIRGARERIDLAHFYYIDAPDDRGADGPLPRSLVDASKLTPIITALEEATARGVQVRVLADGVFAPRYPTLLTRLRALPHATVRVLDGKALYGGVLHAKFMLVDGRDAWLGSQNFDWRSLGHIRELGVRTSAACLVGPLQDLFETDWALAGGAPKSTRVRRAAGGDARPCRVALPTGGEAHDARLVASPRGWLADESRWALPALIDAIDHAERHVAVQLLSMHRHGRDGEPFHDLEDALRRAGARGVRVEVLLSHWTRRKRSIAEAKALAQAPGVTVKLLELPPHSAGFIPFARVTHAKSMVVDDKLAWVGTSNWGRGYFHDSRNVGVIVRGGPFAARVLRHFQRGWGHPQAVAVEPDTSYPEPAVGKPSPAVTRPATD